jgi:uncharacterized protein YecE (DUF72 family)
MGKVFLGTSGWSYKDWVGPFYKTRGESKLKAYSKVFKTAEIDSTFYRFPSKGMVMGWLRYTPSDFVFAAKLPKQITHKGKLESRVVETDLNRFCDLMQPLRLDGKLSCLLAQLPPSLKYDVALLEGFLAIFPSEFRLAVEFRHESWLRAETWRLLERYNVAYTVVDEPLLPPVVKVTSDIAYVRWHGRGERPWYYYLYEPRELEPWVEKVKEAEKQAEKVFGYFNNHYHGYAVRNCLQFAEMIGELTEEQKAAKESVEKYFKEAEAAAKEKMKERGMTLAAYIPEEIERMDFEKLLGMFMDKGRIRRAKAIRDEEIKIEEISDSNVKALIRNYHFSVDSKNRVVLHDCADWSRCAPAKQFCKHVGKVMMTIPKEKATKLMKQIALEREKWEFKPYMAQKISD